MPALFGVNEIEVSCSTPPDSAPVPMPVGAEHVELVDRWRSTYPVGVPKSPDTEARKWTFVPTYTLVTGVWLPLWIERSTEGWASQ